MFVSEVEKKHRDRVLFAETGLILKSQVQIKHFHDDIPKAHQEEKNKRKTDSKLGYQCLTALRRLCVPDVYCIRVAGGKWQKEDDSNNKKKKNQL